MSDSWKLVLPCTRAEAEAIDVEDEALAMLEPPPVLMTSERVADDDGAWQLEAFFDAEPDAMTVAAIRALVPGAAALDIEPEYIPDQDWLTLSQQGLEPVHAGRFYVHTENNRGDVPDGAKAFRIEASTAFGTGQHDTTSGCLMTLDRLKLSGRHFGNILDLGTGTGLLAFAAMHLWPAARATASDIDPRAIEVVRENAAVNAVRLGRGPGALSLAAAPGLEHRLLRTRGPYDLVLANILAGPLIDLAPAIADALAPGGVLVLAGLLERQRAGVARAYRRQGLRVAGRIHGEWPTLRLVKRRAAHRRSHRRRATQTGATADFGSW
ncbi:50S ribosomal protein L11 methyltransferase [Stakelama saccharophila]|uniref:Ribosomal protein L11 methyltransferase n=1 Tax=Stakelama saccharophila TaxID=3075605 RepID=A0ABZ0BAZ5_9SPHN|nr:50S ribosomal protein L11 methyltransferase [Stakelama sp. W311]WNO54435.1 50S ribosomal protein L11 methyltransferase [Stakelama sp. W311]